MSLRGGGGSSTVWRFPATGFAATAAVVAAPGSPLGPAGWPVRGPFGAFTWGAWFVSAGLAATLFLLAAGTAARHGRAARGLVTGRALPAALAYGLLALASFTAASQAEQIRRTPAAALAAALTALVLFRAAAARFAPAAAGPGADVAE